MGHSKSSKLRAAVYRKPEDLDLRLVLADALLEEGDPRGEFISLQVKRLQDGGRPTRREQALSKANGATWLGSLGPYLKQPVFEGGFVTSATLVAPLKRADTAWPEWSTLTALTIGRRVSAALLSELPSLRRVHQLLFDELLTLARASLPWTSVSLQCEPFATDLKALDGARLPALTTLSLSFPDTAFPPFEDLEPLLKSKLFTRLREVTLCVDSEESLERLLQQTARSRLTSLRCQVEDKGRTVSVDFPSKRIEVPSELSEVRAPKGFEVVVGGLSKTAAKAQRVWGEFELLQELKRVEEWDLVWRIQQKQPMTKKVQKLVAALRSGECTVDGIEAWRKAY